MEKLLKKSSHGVIAQLHSIQMQPSAAPTTPLDLQQILDRYTGVFAEPVGLPPSRPEDHRIHLLPGSIPPNIRPFTIESDACGNGLGVVLLQDEHPIAFTSKSIFDKNLAASTYEKEMMAILHAVQKWRPYLLGNHFCIKTDHQSLKYFLE